jgi:diaminobutyrate-2-oxoglutarate transaminase
MIPMANRYSDFFCGAGSLNYGHNNPEIKSAILNYPGFRRHCSWPDTATSAKARFLEQFESVILAPRGPEYKVQFTGPTGTNAFEAALKLARKIKKRSNIIAFTNSSHGLSAGSLAVSARSFYRKEDFLNLSNVSFMPFDGYCGKTSMRSTTFASALKMGAAASICLSRWLSKRYKLKVASA